MYKHLNLERRCFTRLDVNEWEGMHIDAEAAMLGAIFEGEDVVEKLSGHIFRLSEEVRRLRHKCGEDVWHGVSTTREQDEQERIKCKTT